MPRAKRDAAALAGGVSAAGARSTPPRATTQLAATGDGGGAIKRHRRRQAGRAAGRAPPPPPLCLLHRSLTHDAAAAAAALRASVALDRDGFVVIPHFLSSQTLRLLRAEVDAVYRAKAPSVDGEWILNLHQQQGGGVGGGGSGEGGALGGWMWALASSPFVVHLLRAQLGPNVVLYCSQIHSKRALAGDGGSGDGANAGVGTCGDGGGGAGGCGGGRGGGGPGGGGGDRDVPGVNSAVPWHQDGGANVRTLWIALDHVMAESGGLRVLRGGHRLGRLPYAPVATATQLDQATYFAKNNVFRVDDAGFDPAHIVQYEFPAGGAAMHHPITPHASARNTTRRDRRVIILRYHGVDPDTDFPRGVRLPRYDVEGATFEKQMWLVSGRCKGGTVVRAAGGGDAD